MRIRFEYNYNMEYYLKTVSFITIKGQGVWDVAEYNLASEYINSDFENVKEFCLNYFYTELDIDDHSIEFNKTDLQELEEYFEEYKTCYL